MRSTFKTVFYVNGSKEKSGTAIYDIQEAGYNPK